jgi:hypothetical protein
MMVFQRRRIFASTADKPLTLAYGLNDSPVDYAPDFQEKV